MTVEPEQSRGKDYQKTTVTLDAADRERLYLIRYAAARHWPQSIRITTSELIRWALLLAVDSLKDDGFIPETEDTCSSPSS